MDIDIQIAESLIEAFDHEETGILLWDKNDKLLYRNIDMEKRFIRLNVPYIIGESFYERIEKIRKKKLVSEKEISDYYEEVANLSDKKLAATWMMGDLFAMLNDKGLNISDSPISSKNFAELIQSIKSGEISGRIAKEIFEIMVESGENPKKIIDTKGMRQQSDPKELEKMINEILTRNKDKVDQYKAGKEKLFGFFVGQVMKISGGKANPNLVNEILKKKLK